MLAAFTTTGQATEPEKIVGMFGICLVAGFAAVALARWVTGGPRSPDPWDQTAFTPEPELDPPVLCHRCLVPNHPEADFCENCGASVGEYTNYLPFPYLFSIGHGLRLGTSGDFKRSKFTVLGFVILSLAEYSIFAPVYLFQFFRRETPPDAMSSPPPPPA